MMMNNTIDSFLNSGAVPSWAYQHIPFIGIIIVLAIIDLGLRGWSLWRAARMKKNIWFVALLIVNSLGVLPAIFLLLTKEEYAKRVSRFVTTP